MLICKKRGDLREMFSLVQCSNLSRSTVCFLTFLFQKKGCFQQYTSIRILIWVKLVWINYGIVWFFTVFVLLVFGVCGAPRFSVVELWSFVVFLVYVFYRLIGYYLCVVFSHFLCFFLSRVVDFMLIFVFCGLLCDGMICFDMISCHIYL